MTQAMQTNSDQTGGMRNAGSPTPAVFPEPESMRPTIVGRDFVVSAGHPTVAQVMSEVLARGGTAIDAGVAGGLVSNVVQVDMCNFGGVAPTLVKCAGDDTVYMLDGVGNWGANVSLDAFLQRHNGDMPLGSPPGVVPAAFDVWCTVLSRFGTWRLSEVMAPAMDFAQNGFVLDQRTAQALALLGNGFAAYETSRAVYWPNGRAPRTGELLVQSDLARTMERLAERDIGSRVDGIAAARALFYEGEIAEELIAFHRETGGWLTLEDMKAYRPRVGIAPSVSFRGWQIHTTDATGQGPVMLQALGILEGLPLESLPRGSADHLHLIAEALKQGFAERERYYGDPAFTGTRMEDLLSLERLAALREEIAERAVLAGAATAQSGGTARCDTTYFAAADAAGNVISSMPSDTIDGAPIAPGLGFFVSPRGVQSRLDPAHPAAIRAGIRPRLTPAPSIIRNPSTGEVMAVGCPGGDMIVQAMLQSVVDMICFGMTPQQAVEAPRVATFSHPGSFYPHPAFPLRLAYEDRFDSDVVADLSARGHVLHKWPAFEFDAGGVSIAGTRILSDGGVPQLVAAADPRRINYAAGR